MYIEMEVNSRIATTRITEDPTKMDESSGTEIMKQLMFSPNFSFQEVICSF
ncbi:hypothetical protein ACWF7H_09040 [Peribacillus butanolivorans]